MIDLFYEYTEDELMLQGTYFNSEYRECCILFIHGQAQSIIDNKFAYILGKNLSSENIGFLYGHNRGYSYINCISKKDGTLEKVGATFEIFEDCIKDISVWIDKIKHLGFKKIILMGHSLGCNKALYYLSKKPNYVDAVIFCSAPDMIGITKLEEKDFKNLTDEAKQNIADGEPNKILNDLLCDFDYISSKTFINFYTENNAIDNFPIERNPDVFEQLSEITIPILSIAGSLEYSTYLKQELLKDKAIGCMDYNYCLIDNANHFYKNKEDELSNEIIKFVKRIIKN